MVKDSDRDKDKGRDKEDISDIFEDLGQDFSKLIDKLAQEGEANLDVFSNIQNFGDLKDAEGFGGFDFDNLNDLMKEFGLDSSQFDNFDPGPFREKSGTKSAKRERDEPQGPIEPNVDIFDEDETVEVFVELPGIDEDTIDLQISGNRIQLSAGVDPTRYEKEITLPISQISSFTKKFRNGILHLSLTKGVE